MPHFNQHLLSLMDSATLLHTCVDCNWVVVNGRGGRVEGTGTREINTTVLLFIQAIQDYFTYFTPSQAKPIK